MEEPKRPSPIRFGIFEVQAGELRRQGLKIKLQEQPFQILMLLLERPGEVITRDEFQKRLWPADTFVNFESGLNRAINKLRDALGDNSESPRFIETLPRRGYRFIAQVDNAPPPLSRIPSEGSNAPKSSPKRWMLPGAVGLGATLLVFFVLNAGGVWERLLARGAVPRIESLAVLPLQSLSSDSAHDYFADGMTDGLITEIARIGSLRVISRTSMMRFKGTRKSVPMIAKELGVDAVLEGTITFSGQQVRITAQLIRAGDDRHLWSEKYDRDLGDTLKLQSEIAEAIASQIKIKLTQKENVILQRQRHVNPRALEAYAEGMYFGSRVSEGNLSKSAALLTQAIELDPSYAQAYAGLSHSLYVMGMLGFRPAGEAYPQAKRAAEKALDLDPTVADAHNTLAEVKRGYEWDWATAELEYKRALDLNPSFSLAYSGYASVLSNMGRHEEAIAQVRRARELDPVSMSANTAMGRIFFRARRYDDSIKACQKAIELDPNDASPLWWMALSHEQKHEFPQAITALEKAVSLSEATLSQGLLAHAYALTGARDKAVSILNQLQQLSVKRYVSPVDIAVIYAGLDDRNSAFEWLERAYRERTMRIQELPEPIFDNLRPDPRFWDLLGRLNLAK